MGLFDKLKKMFAFSFNEMPDAPPLSPAQSRGLALGLIYAAEGGLPINALTAEADQKTARATVAGPWDAVDTESARENFAFLLGGGHDDMYRLVHEAAAKLDRSGDRNAIARSAEKASADGRAAAASRSLDPDDFEGRFVKWYTATSMGITDRLPESARASMPASIAAWDAARVVQCSRLFIDAGFIAPDEAWAAIAKAVERSRPAYRSWEEFRDGFLVGRYYWTIMNGRSLDDAASDVYTFTIATQEIDKSPASPWKSIPW